MLYKRVNLKSTNESLRVCIIVKLTIESVTLESSILLFISYLLKYSQACLLAVSHKVLLLLYLSSDEIALAAKLGIFLISF